MPVFSKATDLTVCTLLLTAIFTNRLYELSLRTQYSSSFSRTCRILSTEQKRKLKVFHRGIYEKFCDTLSAIFKKFQSNNIRQRNSKKFVISPSFDLKNFATFVQTFLQIPYTNQHQKFFAKAGTKILRDTHKPFCSSQFLANEFLRDFMM